MAITVDAIYENGILKLSEPLPFPEHMRVSVRVEPVCPPLAERIANRALALPSEAIDALPVDLAAQHDHYLYGTPKRPE